MYLIGALDNYAAEEAEKQGRYVIPNPDSGVVYFFRSDHFNFTSGYTGSICLWF